MDGWLLAEDGTGRDTSSVVVHELYYSTRSATSPFAVASALFYPPSTDQVDGRDFAGWVYCVSPPPPASQPANQPDQPPIIHRTTEPYSIFITNERTSCIAILSTHLSVSLVGYLHFIRLWTVVVGMVLTRVWVLCTSIPYIGFDSLLF